jgi:lipoate-protein ligase B
MGKLNQVILAIAVSVLFCLAWDAVSRHNQSEEAKQDYFPVIPVFKVQAGGHMTYTGIGK